MTSFIRNVEIVVGRDNDAISIRDLYVSFDIKKEAHGTPANGSVSIYNLSADVENRIRQRDVRVQVLTGYAYDPETRRQKPANRLDEDLSLLFEGDVRQVERERGDLIKHEITTRGREERRRRQGLEPPTPNPHASTKQRLNRITKLNVGGMIASRREAMFEKSYGEGYVALRTLLRDIAATFKDINLGPLDAVRPGHALKDYAFSGPSVEALEAIVPPFGLRWYIEDSVMKFASVIDPNINIRPDWVVNEQNGMIGSPSVTDDGLRVRTLLDPRYRLEDYMVVESRLTSDLGVHRIFSIHHQGDNRAGDFFSTLELRPV